MANLEPNTLPLMAAAAVGGVAISLVISANADQHEKQPIVRYNEAGALLRP